MKIKRFQKFLNENKDSLGDNFSLRNIKKGTEVTYQGTKYYVIDSNEVVLELSKNKESKKGEKENFLVNRNMFRENGTIRG